MNFRQFVIFLTLCLVGAGCTDIGSHEKVLLLTINSETEIHIAGQEEILDLEELILIAKSYLKLPVRQSYVILDAADNELRRKVKTVLIQAGVDINHIVSRGQASDGQASAQKLVTAEF